MNPENPKSPQHSTPHAGAHVPADPPASLSRRSFVLASAATAAVPALARAQTTAAAGTATPAAPTAAPGDIPLSLTVNGTRHEWSIRPEETLLDVLQHRHNLPSARRDCRGGSCGVCTVLLSGRRVPACLVPALLAQGQAVATAEGLSPEGSLSPIQKAFLDHDAVECGYCTPGQVITAQAILTEPCGHTAEDIREALTGHKCECGKLPEIIAAIQHVKRQTR
jgi:xanthine dehydrogenase YagT iron-sulfur-binding subunit